MFLEFAWDFGKVSISGRSSISSDEDGSQLKLDGLIRIGNFLIFFSEGLDICLDGLADFLLEGHGFSDFPALVVVLVVDGGGSCCGEEE